jgi:hypothetical protein
MTAGRHITPTSLIILHSPKHIHTILAWNGVHLSPQTHLDTTQQVHMDRATKEDLIPMGLFREVLIKHYRISKVRKVLLESLGILLREAPTQCDVFHRPRDSVHSMS